MIGVLADPSDRSLVEEFFELFKTPWEFCRSDKQYPVLLCVGDCDEHKEFGARLVLIYSRQGCHSEGTGGLQASVDQGGRVLSNRGARFPLYSGSRTFVEGNADLLADAASGKPAIKKSQSNGAVVFWIGYDLLRELRHLLTVGQPAANAATPTLDLHIALLRDLICSAEVPFVEVPPLPYGYRFIACLTHDIDHPGIRYHKFDRTMFGFLYRATIGSLVDSLQGRISAAKVLRNWLAAMKLPFVYLGWAADFWKDFDRYTELEADCPSSFFAIPFKNRPGRTAVASEKRHRAAAYGAPDIAAKLRKLVAANCEVGLHGIDAWTDSSAGREEIAHIRSITGAGEIGTRMHWLFFNADSPVVLERAGASYDSTVGYNETVGYRAGTSQAYKPLNVSSLLELPLLIMDTALFYPAYLHLSPKAAASRINEIIDAAAKRGGCVTVNWHDRSIAPERLWTDTYVDLIAELRRKGAWFATASQATAWFRMRRSLKFSVNQDGSVQAVPTASSPGALPPLTLRTYTGNVIEPRDRALPGSERISPISDAAPLDAAPSYSLLAKESTLS